MKVSKHVTACTLLTRSDWATWICAATLIWKGVCPALVSHTCLLTLTVFRFKFIEMYCKSVSRESESGYSVRVRPKPIYSLTEIVIPDNGLTNLPLQGYKATSEQFAVQSILMFNSMEKTFSK